MSQATNSQVSPPDVAYSPPIELPPTDPVELPEEAVEAQLAQGDFAGIGAVTAVSSG